MLFKISFLSLATFYVLFVLTACSGQRGNATGDGFDTTTRGRASLVAGADFASLLLDPTQCPKSDCNCCAFCPSGAYWVSSHDDLYQLGSEIAKLQKYAQWTNSHYAILVEPGTYAMKDPKTKNPAIFELGYYTQVLGLGSQNSDVTISPGIEVHNQGTPTMGTYWNQGTQGTDCDQAFVLGSDVACLTTGGLNNFWRGMENLSIDASYISTLPYSPAYRWAVSQASPLRNFHL